MIHLDFFHDAVCGWCYVLSPRLRSIASRYPVIINHRAFVLQKNESEIIQRFGSLKSAKFEILQHWRQCKKFADNPDLINIEGMRKASFNYPSGYLAARYAKSIEVLLGQKEHWDFFDEVQKIHLYKNLNIGEKSVLDSVVESLGMPIDKIHNILLSEQVDKALEADFKTAENVGIRSIPTIILNKRKVVSQTLSYQQLEKLIESELTQTEGKLA